MMKPRSSALGRSEAISWPSASTAMPRSTTRGSGSMSGAIDQPDGPFLLDHRDGDQVHVGGESVIDIRASSRRRDRLHSQGEPIDACHRPLPDVPAARQTHVKPALNADLFRRPPKGIGALLAGTVPRTRFKDR